MYLLGTCSTISWIAAAKGQSWRTVGNQLRLAQELGLVYRQGREVHLSACGQQYVEARDSLNPMDFVSSAQADIIRRFIIPNPFFSGATFGILTMAASIFELSKNTYPVPLHLVSRYFIDAAGLGYKWSSESAVRHGVRMYTNYAIDLGLVGKVGRSYFVTPSGLNFVLLLNMHKSLKLIENTRRIE